MTNNKKLSKKATVYSDLSLVIPTYNEAENIVPLVQQINSCLEGVAYEIIFVDDSSDNTIEKIIEVSKKNKHIFFEHRDNQRGLASAVIRGIELSHSEFVAVMDADMQHPPSLIKEMLKEETKKHSDIIIPSRFISGGDDGGLSLSRKLVSFVARWIARILFKSVRKVSDPTSGIFMFRKSIIKNKTLRPTGWKILIEILVISDYKSITEIPYRFQSRRYGKSKMSFKEQINYLTHIFSLLYRSPKDRRFFVFMCVGLSGVVVNLIVYDIFVKIFSVNVLLSGIISASTAVVTNFILNDKYTWSEQKNDQRHQRLIKYIIVSSIGIAVNALILALLFYGFSLNYLLSNISGIVIASILNFKLNDIWTWKYNKND